MRTTITIPDKYYNYIKSILHKTGYTSVNDLILSLIRERFPVSYGIIEKKYETTGSNKVELPVSAPEEKVTQTEPGSSGDNPIRYILDKCQAPNCIKRAVGLYKVTLTVEGVEQAKNLFLCTTHLQNAQKSGGEPQKIE